MPRRWFEIQKRLKFDAFSSCVIHDASLAAAYRDEPRSSLKLFPELGLFECEALHEPGICLQSRQCGNVWPPRVAWTLLSSFAKRLSIRSMRVKTCSSNSDHNGELSYEC